MFPSDTRYKSICCSAKLCNNMAILCLIYKKKRKKKRILSVHEYEIGKKPEFDSMKVTVFM